LSDSDPVSAADPVPETARPSAIDAVAGDGSNEGGLAQAITVSTQDADEHDGPDEQRRTPGAAVSPNARLAISVLTELVDRAGSGVCSVLVGAAPAAHVVFNVVQPALETALGFAPDAVAAAVQDAVRSIVRLAKWVFRRAYDMLNLVMQGNSNVVATFLDSAKEHGTELVLPACTLHCGEDL
jgi:hypothetical protein